MKKTKIFPREAQQLFPSWKAMDQARTCHREWETPSQYSTARYTEIEKKRDKALKLCKEAEEERAAHKKIYALGDLYERIKWNDS